MSLGTFLNVPNKRDLRNVLFGYGNDKKINQIIEWAVCSFVLFVFFL